MHQGTTESHRLCKICVVKRKKIYNEERRGNK